MLNTTIAAPGTEARMRCAASIPFRFGMAMSSTTTSGRDASAASTACLPSEASATTLNSGCPSSSRRKPRRTTVWSSANRMRIFLSLAASKFSFSVHFTPGERQFHGEQGSATGRRMDVASAAQAGHALLDSQQTHALALLELEAPAIVLDGKLEPVRLFLHPDANGLGLRVARAVVQRLLHYAIDTCFVRIRIIIRASFIRHAHIDGRTLGHLARLPAQRRH